MKNHVNIMKIVNERDSEIKNLVIRFRNFKSSSTKRKLISILSPIIVQYPAYYKYKDKDFHHDFYLFVISNFDKLLCSYKPLTDCKFMTWFSLILNRKLWSFLRIERRKRSHRIEENFTRKELHDTYSVAEDTVTYEKEELYDFCNTILHSNLSLKEKKVLILKFSNACIAKTEDPLLIKKMHRIEEIKQRIHKNQFTILRLKKLLSECICEERRKKIIENLERVENSQQNKKKVLESFDICRSNKWIAQQLNIKTSTVSSLLLRAKKKLKDENTPLGLFPAVDNGDNKI